MISAKQLTGALMGVGIPLECIQLFDEDFECPEPSWITGELREAFESALFRSGIMGREGQYDCNKIAKLASTVADLCWYKTQKSEAVLAFGVLGVPGHMVCVAVHTDESGLWVGCYDPTPQVPPGLPVTDGTTLRPVYFTKEEYQSCLCCIFV
jgi:hypothetical protein